MLRKEKRISETCEDQFCTEGGSVFLSEGRCWLLEAESGLWEAEGQEKPVSVTNNCELSPSR